MDDFISLKKSKVFVSLNFVICKENNTAKQEMVDAQKKNKLKAITDRYAPENILNVNKMGLFFYHNT